MRSTKLTDMAVLFVEANEGRGIFQTVADLLASALSWPVTAEEARNWLTKLSHADGPALVLAVDGLGPDHDVARRELVAGAPARELADELLTCCPLMRTDEVIQ